MSEQYAFRVRLKPGAAAEYVRLHSPVPEAITAQLLDAGVHDYSIFVDGDDVFGVLRYDDLETMRTRLAADVAPEWTRQVSDLMVDRVVDPAYGLLAGMTRVFRLDRGDH